MQNQLICIDINKRSHKIALVPFSEPRDGPAPGALNPAKDPTVPISVAPLSALTPDVTPPDAPLVVSIPSPTDSVVEIDRDADDNSLPSYNVDTRTDSGSYIATVQPASILNVLLVVVFLAFHS